MFRLVDDGGVDGTDDAGYGVALLTDRDDDGPDESVADDAGRSKRFALTALGVVVAIVAVSITLVALLVDAPSALAASPASAAQQWASDIVHGDDAGRQALECGGRRTDAQVLSLLLTDVSGARAGTARQLAAARWRVPLRFLGPDGSSELSYVVQVVRRGGRYLVC